MRRTVTITPEPRPYPYTIHVCDLCGKESQVETALGIKFHRDG